MKRIGLIFTLLFLSSYLLFSQNNADTNNFYYQILSKFSRQKVNNNKEPIYIHIPIFGFKNFEEIPSMIGNRPLKILKSKDLIRISKENKKYFLLTMSLDEKDKLIIYLSPRKGLVYGTFQHRYEFKYNCNIGKYILLNHHLCEESGIYRKYENATRFDDEKDIFIGNEPNLSKPYYFKIEDTSDYKWTHYKRYSVEYDHDTIVGLSAIRSIGYPFSVKNADSTNTFFKCMEKHLESKYSRKLYEKKDTIQIVMSINSERDYVFNEFPQYIDGKNIELTSDLFLYLKYGQSDKKVIHIDVIANNKGKLIVYIRDLKNGTKKRYRSNELIIKEKSYSKFELSFDCESSEYKIISAYHSKD